MKYVARMQPFLPALGLTAAIASGPLSWYVFDMKSSIGFVLHLLFFVGIGVFLPKVCVQITTSNRAAKRVRFKICDCGDEPRHGTFVGSCGAPLPYIFYSQRRALRIASTAHYHGHITWRNKRRLQRQIKKSNLPIKDPQGVQSQRQQSAEILPFIMSSYLIVIEVGKDPD
jgi:hypothetical protein